jgi:hypothetical protein
MQINMTKKEANLAIGKVMRGFDGDGFLRCMEALGFKFKEELEEKLKFHDRDCEQVFGHDGIYYAIPMKTIMQKLQEKGYCVYRIGVE